MAMMYKIITVKYTYGLNQESSTIKQTNCTLDTAAEFFWEQDENASVPKKKELAK